MRPRQSLAMPPSTGDPCRADENTAHLDGGDAELPGCMMSQTLSKLTSTFA
jgi:hypothetical protein